MKDKELEIALNHDNIMTFSDLINTRIAYETVYQEKDKKIERLNNIIEKLEQENAVLKTQVVNKDKYSYGIRAGSDKEC